MSRLVPAELKRLTKAATKARDNAYCPYSNHPVGAAIQSESGKVFIGCNVENAHYNCTHAEASAISAMVAAGARRIKAIVIIGPSSEYLCTPCGDCRQRIREFSDGKVKVYCLWKSGRLGKVYDFDDLLPDSFGPENLAELGKGPKTKKKPAK